MMGGIVIHDCTIGELRISLGRSGRVNAIGMGLE